MGWIEKLGSVNHHREFLTLNAWMLGKELREKIFFLPSSNEEKPRTKHCSELGCTRTAEDMLNIEI